MRDAAQSQRRAARLPPVSSDDDEDGHPAAWMPAADMQLHDAANQRHEHDGEQRADVDHHQLFAQQIREIERDGDAEREEHDAARSSSVWTGSCGGSCFAMCLDVVRSKALKDALDDILRRAVRGVDGEVRLAVPGKALAPAFREALPVSEHRTNGPPSWVAQRAIMVSRGASRKTTACRGEPGEEVAGCALFERAAAKSQDQVVRRWQEASRTIRPRVRGMRTHRGGRRCRQWSWRRGLPRARPNRRTSHPSRSASRAPTVVLPAPIKPVRINPRRMGRKRLPALAETRSCFADYMNGRASRASAYFLATAAVGGSGLS